MWIQRPTLANEQHTLSALSAAVSEAVEEAIYNSLFMAQSTTGRDGNTRYALPVAEVVALVEKR